MYTVRIRGEKSRIFFNLSDMEKFVRCISRLMTYTKDRDWIHLEVFGKDMDEELDRKSEQFYQQCITDACVEHH
jgi:hypothetical protein